MGVTHGTKMDFTAYQKNALEKIENLSKELEIPPSKEQGEFLLSVILVANNPKYELLKETLMCLCAQDNNSFEVITIAPSNSNTDVINDVLETIPQNVLDKLTLITTDTDNLAKCYNQGLNSLKGSYFTLIEQGDILLPNWVEEFADLSKQNSTNVLHTYNLTQLIEEMEYKQTIVLCIKEDFFNFYAKPYDYFLNTVAFDCKTCVFAFNSKIIRGYGIIFDESIQDYPQWLFLAQTAYLCKVEDKGTVTAFNRQRVVESVSSSQIKEKLQNTGFLFSAEQVQKIAESTKKYAEIKAKGEFATKTELNRYITAYFSIEEHRNALEDMRVKIENEFNVLQKDHIELKEKHEDFIKETASKEGYLEEQTAKTEAMQKRVELTEEIARLLATEKWQEYTKTKEFKGNREKWRTLENIKMLTNDELYNLALQLRQIG